MKIGDRVRIRSDHPDTEGKSGRITSLHTPAGDSYVGVALNSEDDWYVKRDRLELLPDDPTSADPGSDYNRIATEIAELVKTKNACYGDSFGRSGNVLRELYPNGIKPEQYDDLLTIARILDKLFRVATDKGALGESPWRDTAGYALLAAVRDAK